MSEHRSAGIGAIVVFVLGLLYAQFKSNPEVNAVLAGCVPDPAIRETLIAPAAGLLGWTLWLDACRQRRPTPRSDRAIRPTSGACRLTT